MGYRKENKEKALRKKDWLLKLKSGWKSKRPIVFFVGGFFLLMVLFYIFWLTKWSNDHLFPIITATNAYLSCKALYLLGQNTTSAGGIISSPLFSLSVARGCEGVEAMAIFVSALLVFPVSWRKKIPGVAIGVIILFLLNLVRIITLFLMGVYYPSYFEVMHVEVWQGIYILAAVALWASWVYIATKTKSSGAS